MPIEPDLCGSHLGVTYRRQGESSKYQAVSSYDQGGHVREQLDERGGGGDRQDANPDYE